MFKCICTIADDGDTQYCGIVVGSDQDKCVLQQLAAAVVVGAGVGLLL